MLSREVASKIDVKRPTGQRRQQKPMRQNNSARKMNEEEIGWRDFNPADGQAKIKLRVEAEKLKQRIAAPKSDIQKIKLLMN